MFGRMEASSWGSRAQPGSRRSSSVYLPSTTSFRAILNVVSIVTLLCVGIIIVLSILVSNERDKQEDVSLIPLLALSLALAIMVLVLVLFLVFYLICLIRKDSEYEKIDAEATEVIDMIPEQRTQRQGRVFRVHPRGHTLRGWETRQYPKNDFRDEVEEVV